MTEAPQFTAPEPPPQTEPAPNPTPDTDEQVSPEKYAALLRDSRKWQTRAQENFEKAKEYDKFVDQQKTEQQRLEDRAAAAERERDAVKADALRYKVASKHGITGDDVDLLEGISDEDKLNARALRILELRKAAEKQTPAQPTPARPKENLRPGATPTDHKSEDDLVYEQLFGAK